MSTPADQVAPEKRVNRIQHRLKSNTEATIGVEFGIGPVSPDKQPPVTALGDCFNCPLESVCELGKRSAFFENISCDPPQPFVRANVKTKGDSLGGSEKACIEGGHSLDDLGPLP
jgi:hypothetical protein